MMGNKKLQVWLPLMFSLVLIVGMLLGYKLGNKHGGSDFFSSNRRTTLQEALDIIRLRYVDSVSIDSLQGKAIEEMMTGLDPHSFYLPPADLKEANQDLEGSFEGIGIEFNIFSDTINIVYVIPGGPAEKAGLLVGDKVLKVNDSLLTAGRLTTDKVRKIIQGAKGSNAVLQLLRNGKPLTITIARNTIHISSVDAAYMIDKTTGYIRLDKFTDKSYEEFMDAMEKLKKEGLQDLVFDLRENGGGYMNEAVDIADEFLEGDKLVVYTEGANSKKQEYRCKRPGIFEKGKLVLLVDELSASASEALAGALQDWCRATIIGRRTFGKGLVQDQYPLKDGSALRLTIARYYTPIGRSIQRSYEKGTKVYMDDLWERSLSGELLFADSNKINNGKPFVTVCKDTVYGGGGIMPNIFVAIDTLYEQQVNHLLGSSNINAFVYNYYLQHKSELEQFSSASEYNNRFNTAALWAAYSKISNLPSGYSQELVTLQLKALLARYKWRRPGYYEVLNTNDAVVKKALEKLRN